MFPSDPVCIDILHNMDDPVSILVQSHEIFQKSKIYE